MRIIFLSFFLFLLCKIEVFSQEKNIILSSTNYDQYFLVGNLPYDGPTNNQKLKISVFGGSWHNTTLGEAVFYISTRGGTRINREIHGGSIDNRYDLNIFDNGSSYDFVIHFTKNYPAVQIRSWHLQYGTTTDFPIDTYDPTGKTDITSQYRINDIFSTNSVGDIGIGTPDPSNKLTIISHIDENNIGRGRFFFDHYKGHEAFFRMYNGNNWGLLMRSESNSPKIGTFYNGNVQIHPYSSSTGDLDTIKGPLTTFNFSTMKVGIGTTTPDEKLTVKGNIHTEEVRVDLSVPAPDYVFEPDYDLITLDEISEYIKEYKHLPEVPSASDFETSGIELSKMNMLLLKKVEELTLYTIDQEGQLKTQAHLIEKQNKLLNELLLRIEKIENNEQ